MLLACNWSKYLNTLLEKDVANIDYIKSGVYGMFYEKILNMRSKKPVLLHGLGYFERTGMNNIEAIDFKHANNLIEKCSSPHLGVHLAIKNSDMSSNMTDADIYERMSKQVQIFKKNLSVPLLLENCPDSPEDRIQFDHHPFFDADLISHFLAANDVGFLLDLTHAKITAQYNNLNIKDYIKKLPLNRVAEIHVNGSSFDKNNFPIDTHQSMEKQDYELLEWVLQYTKPSIISLEYNGIEDESDYTIISSLEKQLYEIRNICAL